MNLGPLGSPTYRLVRHLPKALPIIALLAIASACVTQGTFDEMQAERDALSGQNAQLQGELLESRSEVEAVSDTLARERQVGANSRDAYRQLVAQLSGEVALERLAVEQMASGIRVRIPEDVLFTSGSADLADSGITVIQALSGQLKDTPYQIVVGGYTDNVPIGGALGKIYPTNWDLAGARAAHVVTVLEAAGIPSAQLLAVSFGKTDPIASNDTPEGRAENRRIEVRIRPIEIEGSPVPSVGAGPPQ